MSQHSYLRNQQKKLTAQLRSVSQGQGVGYTAEYNREASDALDARGECKAARAAIRELHSPTHSTFPQVRWHVASL